MHCGLQLIDCFVLRVYCLVLCMQYEFVTFHIRFGMEGVGFKFFILDLNGVGWVL